MKKSTKSFFAMLSCVVLLMTSVASAFTDLPSSHWAYDNINKMYNGEIIAGFEDGTFRPDDLVTREQFITIFVKALNIEPLEVVYEFEDVEDNRWSKPYIDMAFAYLPFETIEGKNYFRPAEPVTREDVAYALTSSDGVPDYTSLDRFIDKDEISEDKKRYVSVVVGQGIMNGNPDGTFKPKNGLTRAELATVICNAAKLANIEIDFPKFNGDILDLGKDWSKYKFAYSNKDKIVDVDEWGWYTASTRYLKEKESPNGDLTIGWVPGTKYLDIMTMDDVFVKKVKLPESDYIYTTIEVNSNTGNVLTENTKMEITINGTEKYNEVDVSIRYKDENGKYASTKSITKKVNDSRVECEVKEFIDKNLKSDTVSVNIKVKSGTIYGSDGYIIDFTKEKNELPNFKYVIEEDSWGYVDLTSNYSKYEYSYSAGDIPINWYEPLTRKIKLDQDAGKNKSINEYSINAFVRYKGDTENYVTIPLKHHEPKLEINYEDECIYLENGKYGFFFIYDTGKNKRVIPDDVEPYEDYSMPYLLNRNFDGGYVTSSKINLADAMEFMRKDTYNDVEVCVWKMSDFKEVYPSGVARISIDRNKVENISNIPNKAKLRCGDIDGDGRIDGNDESLINKYIMGKIEFTEEKMQRADTFKDKKIDVMDRKLIMMYTYDSIDELPHTCGKYEVVTDSLHDEIHQITYRCRCGEVATTESGIHIYKDGKCVCGKEE